jgi:hypothetical protein
VRSFAAKGSSYLEDGGNVESSSSNMSKQISEVLQNTPIFVTVDSIETGMTQRNNVKKVGVF